LAKRRAGFEALSSANRPLWTKILFDDLNLIQKNWQTKFWWLWCFKVPNPERSPHGRFSFC